ncbi:MAG: RluA family pseudouridine synthase [Oligoflexus sp.]
MERYRIQVKGSMQGKRLDLAIVAANIGLSRRKARRIIDLGGSYINRKRVRVASRPVEFGDIIELEYNPQAYQQLKKADIHLSAEDIIYEGHDFLAVNKPPGLPSQATKTQAVFHVVAQLKKVLEAQGKKHSKLQLAHRLDKETSGVLILANRAEAMTWVSDQFRQRQIEKTYHAISYGLSKLDQFSVACQLSAIQPETGIVKVVNRGGKESVTHFKVLKRFPEWNLTLFQCQPITGRSHQIRVHLAHRGFPIVGDKVYGQEKHKELPDEVQSIITQHHMLHCSAMQFVPAPAADQVRIHADYPPQFKELLLRLGHLDITKEL